MSITWIATILVIEDCLSELKLISNYLTDRGYNVIKATSAEEALKIILEEKPDAIFTDVVMLEMSGFELCRFIKINPTNQNRGFLRRDKSPSLQVFWSYLYCIKIG
ncbi:response regulator [Nostoc edaphicum CCNP1411]|uniref:Response regulator n=1 Tax=Nostoc edaphicum CCNP1411 TaxID=1472755 RepID=A0A7D7LE19_9NOSO|nr:response regulator [Nostoc edaphicum]QMS89550.1 response regulator [Nostoc edaphicum CCNP1411]